MEEESRAFAAFNEHIGFYPLVRGDAALMKDLARCSGPRLTEEAQLAYADLYGADLSAGEMDHLSRDDERRQTAVGEDISCGRRRSEHRSGWRQETQLEGGRYEHVRDAGRDKQG